LAVNTLKIANYSVSVIESSVGSTNRDVDIIFNNNSGAQAELLVMSVVNLSTPPSTGYNVTYQLLKINAGTGSETVLYERNWTGSVENPGQTVSTYQDFTALSSTTVNDGITRTLRSSIQGGISGGAINIFQNDLIIFARFK
jgi:hypothetical protein